MTTSANHPTSSGPPERRSARKWRDSPRSNDWPAEKEERRCSRRRAGPALNEVADGQARRHSRELCGQRGGGGGREGDAGVQELTGLARELCTSFCGF